MKKPSTTLVLSHESNFEDYITDYAKANKLPMSGEEWERALAAARRLDYTAKRDAQPNMRLIPSSRSSVRRKLSLVRRLMTRLLRRSRQQVHLSELDDIQAFLRGAKKTAATVSQISWGPLRNGFGTWVMATLRPGGEQEGSRPTPPRLRDAAEWDLLAARRQLNGKALYARGHLLHNEAGGPGVDYNLVILTAAPGGDFGANHANWAHRYLIEGLLLWAYRTMHSHFGTPTITEIYYEVVADYDRLPRKRTEELQQIADAYWEAAKLAGSRSGLVPEIDRSVLTHQQVMSELAKNPPSAHLYDAMSAVSALDGEHWWQVYQRIERNLELWVFEDRNVPKALVIRYSWYENGIMYGPREEKISIILPSSLAARFEM